MTEKEVNIVTDETLREMKKHGTERFPFQYYQEHFNWNRLETVEWHWHSELEFVEILQGAIECHIGEEIIELREGDTFFINSGVIHKYQAPKVCREKQCMFSDILFLPEIIAPNSSLIYEKYIRPIVLYGKPFLVMRQTQAWEESVQNLYHHIVNVCLAEEDLTELRIQAGVSELWTRLFHYLYREESEQQENKNILAQARLRKMMQFIWDHFHEKITLDDIAASANISKSAALRCFRSGMQTSPVGYLNDFRLNRAKELLLTSHSTVSEIAVSVGFDNVGYFDRVFRRTFGLTPKQFAKQGGECV
ncbi:AraC family transcriptional regulator [Butyricicoccus intestinisimiae]|uniref:AraC family transcriptional regulator n=1 Tax=Butyricicoccus intestinisimiae TaxID=2841509 RepID=A0ABS6EN22_9FIRM|nr:AraC family transcriptional regulator [Butyricicoccus intestinisimiae]MBU5489092.1 AraC family transcriptional regulator [Butyricicoccus intestinisimiae]